VQLNINLFDLYHFPLAFCSACFLASSAIMADCICFLAAEPPLDLLSFFGLGHTFCTSSMNWVQN
jgi:hypothetical protein